jgi:hypothetical protein
MDLPNKIWLANEIRVWGLAATATIGIISFIATWTHTRWTAEYAAVKDEAAKIAKQESDERIAEANARAAEANLKAETERVERLKIEARLADRTLTQEDLDLIQGKLSAYRDQEYQITTFWESREPLNFANQIHRVLAASRWKFIPPGPGGSLLLGVVEGIDVFRHPEASDSAKQAAQALVAALNSVSQSARLRDSAGPTTNQIAINVGTKP